MSNTELASGELIGRKVVILPHYSYNSDKARFIGMTADVTGMKPCGHYELNIPSISSVIDLYCWNDDMLQPVDSVAIPQKPSNDKKTWYAIVHQDENGVFSIIGTVPCTEETFSTVEAILEIMDDIDYEVMPLNDAAKMLEV